MKTITLIHEYAVTPDRLWALATDYDALQEVMQKIVVFEGIPKGRAKTGQKVDVLVSLFGRLPSRPYSMEILECNDENMLLRSSERGAGVKQWKHTLMVTEVQGGSRLVDKIEIDAGLMTPIFALWARFMYRARHKPRVRLLESGKF